MVIIQIDFSEKFAVKFQDEAQSAYYNQRQILIFTCCAWSAQKTRCMTVLSNFVEQNKFSVARCLTVIIENLKKNIPCMKRLLVFSDGAGSQFKNKFTLSNLVYVKEDYNLKVSWAFSATAHGKGAVDGIGATLKRFLYIILYLLYNFKLLTIFNHVSATSQLYETSHPQHGMTNKWIERPTVE